MRMQLPGGMAKTSITVTEETLNRFRDLKETLEENQPDAPAHTNESFLGALLDTWEAVQNGEYEETVEVVGVDDVADELDVDTEELEEKLKDMMVFVENTHHRVERIEEAMQ